MSLICWAAGGVGILVGLLILCAILFANTRVTVVKIVHVHMERLGDVEVVAQVGLNEPERP